MKPFTLARLGYQALLRKVPVAPAASPIGSVRAFGIFDRFTNSFEERREKRVEHKKGSRSIWLCSSSLPPYSIVFDVPQRKFSRLRLSF